MKLNMRDENGWRIPRKPLGTAVYMDECAFSLAAAIALVAGRMQLTANVILTPTRGFKRSALARQIAMYLVHINLGWTFTKIGKLFRRDRTTVAHACARVEDLRDEPNFDELIEEVESQLRAIIGRCQWVVLKVNKEGFYDKMA